MRAQVWSALARSEQLASETGQACLHRRRALLHHSRLARYACSQSGCGSPAERHGIHVPVPARSKLISAGSVQASSQAVFLAATCNVPRGHRNRRSAIRCSPFSHAFHEIHAAGGSSLTHAIGVHTAPGSPVRSSQTAIFCSYRTVLPLLRYGIFSCSSWAWGYFNAYAAAAATQLDFWLHVGDYIYECASAKVHCSM